MNYPLTYLTTEFSCMNTRVQGYLRYPVIPETATCAGRYNTGPMGDTWYFGKEAKGQVRHDGEFLVPCV